MYRWFAKDLCWKEKREEGWVECNPEIPEWAQDIAEIPAFRFIPVWVKASSLNDVKKEFFWCSLEELQGQAEEVNEWLEAHEYESLPERGLRTDELLNPAELQELEDGGYLQKKAPPPKPKYQSDSDPYLPRQHIQITEGGGSRFTARH